MWVFGYEMWEVDEGTELSQDPTFHPVDVVLGEKDTLEAALSELLEWARNEQDRAEEYEMSYWNDLIPAILNEWFKTDRDDVPKDISIIDMYRTEFYVMHI